MKTCLSLCKPASSERSETLLFAGLGFVSLVAITLAVIDLSKFAEQENKVAAAFWATSSATGQGWAPGNYISSGQWRADALTLVAMARFLMENDCDSQTNSFSVVNPSRRKSV